MNILKNGVKKYGIHLISAGVIVLLCLINIRILDYPAVLNDEFGYWGNAVSFVGYDWSELIAENPYYSWGYSIWLVPIVLLLPEYFWYKAAIGLNVVFLLCAYILCFKFGKKIYVSIEEWKIAAVALLVSIYPSNISYAQVSWSETLLYFLMWLITYLFLCLDKKYSSKLVLVISLLLGYSYIVHARSIGLVFVGFISLAALMRKHQKKYGMLVIVLGILVFLYLANNMVKDNIIIELYSNSTISALNNVGLDRNTISLYLERIFSDFKLLLISLGGKLTYILLGTCLVISLSLVDIIEKTIRFIKTKEMGANYLITEYWCLFSAVVMWGLGSVQMMNWEERKDIIVYSRYFENTLGPILFLSIMGLMYKQIHNKIWCILSGIVATVGLIISCHCINGASGFFNSICSPIFGALYDMLVSPQYLIIITIAICFWSLLMILTANKRRYLFLWIFIFYFVLAYRGPQYVNNYRLRLDEDILSVKYEIEWIRNYENIYYVKSEKDLYSANPKYLQFMMPEDTILVCEQEDIKNILEENTLILCNPLDKKIKIILQKNGASEEFSTNMLSLYRFEK